MNATVTKLDDHRQEWNGWFSITDRIDGKTPAEMEDRFLVWIPDANDDWPGEEHIAWWNPEANRIDGEWRHIGDVPGLNELEPTHWQLLPGEPRGLV